MDKLFSFSFYAHQVDPQIKNIVSHLPNIDTAIAWWNESPARAPNKPTPADTATSIADLLNIPFSCMDPLS